MGVKLLPGDIIELIDRKDKSEARFRILGRKELPVIEVDLGIIDANVSEASPKQYTNGNSNLKYLNVPRGFIARYEVRILSPVKVQFAMPPAEPWGVIGNEYSTKSYLPWYGEINTEKYFEVWIPEEMNFGMNIANPYPSKQRIRLLVSGELYEVTRTEEKAPIKARVITRFTR